MEEENLLKSLYENFEGDIFTDGSSRLMYATDASAYREIPYAVVRPKNKNDIKHLVRYALEHKLSLIPRTAGTSLAGQVVGKGIVVDVSKYMNRILEINRNERWALVEPGVILDELNQKLQPFGLFFAPETSTSNRCMIGGMVGNNSCGAHSLIYGSTRDHVLEIEAILSDGSEAIFRSITASEFESKRRASTLEGSIYRNIYDLLSKSANREEIRKEFPDPALKRRNTGYAIDLLLDCEPFTDKGSPFNFCTLLAGSEGTLAFTTAVKLNLLPLPPPVTGLLCVHFNSLDDALHGNLIALKHSPGSVELMDKAIMDCTRDSMSQRHNRFFIEGDPAAILIIEWARNTLEEIRTLALGTEQDLRAAGLGYHFPLILGKDQKKVWNLRKAGLGVLTNMPGDAKPTSFVEDTAVMPALLPSYITEFRQMLESRNLSCVYYAHIATGELHTKPVLNLKDPKGQILYYLVALETAKLVKKYRGSLSGEHGDGRLRGFFIPQMIGDHNYSLLCRIKETWDPAGIFNPGKITAAPAMNTFLRYNPEQKTKAVPTIFNYSGNQGWLRAVEQCNGSADCRKSSLAGGTMCPSYMATSEERNSTRARANLLREYLTINPDGISPGKEEVLGILDLCLSCKGCKAECPSGIDMAKYKAEFLQHYYDIHKVPLRTSLVAGISRIWRMFSVFPGLFNAIVKSKILSGRMKKTLGFAEKRTLPLISKITLRKWVKNNPSEGTGKKIYFFADEFTNHTDVQTGIKSIRLLRRLGYDPIIPEHKESGRSYISKGLLRKARGLAESNVLGLMLPVNDECPLIGIEPSAILCFRDEYPDLVDDSLKDAAKDLAKRCLTIEEFIASELDKGNIDMNKFSHGELQIKLHGHCFQKALTTTSPALKMLSIPPNYKVEEITSGCCGMAGSFGYEKEHYDLSMKIGEMILFPAIRQSMPGVIIAASGTSCRQHILDGTGVKALHPAEILFDALINSDNES